MSRMVLLVCFGLAAASPLSAKEPSLRRTLNGHANKVESVVFSPDGETLASGGSDRTVRLWSLRTGKNIATVSDDDALFGCVAFNQDGGAIAAMWGANGRTIDLWDIATSKKTATIDTSDQIDYKVNPDGSISVSFEANHSAALSRDGKTLAWGTYDGAIILWEATAGKKMATLRARRSDGPLTFSPDGKTLVSTSVGRIALWDVATRKNTATIAVSAPAQAIAFSPDGKMLALSGEAPSLRDPRAGKPPSADTNSTITLWDAVTGRNIATLRSHPLYTLALAFSPDGKTLASGGLDGTIKLRDVSSGKNTAVLGGHTAAVLSVAFSPDGTILASGSADNTVRLWDIVRQR